MPFLMTQSLNEDFFCNVLFILSFSTYFYVETLSVCLTWSASPTRLVPTQQRPNNTSQLLFHQNLALYSNPCSELSMQANIFPVCMIMCVCVYVFYSVCNGMKMFWKSHRWNIKWWVQGILRHKEKSNTHSSFRLGRALIAWGNSPKLL